MTSSTTRSAISRTTFRGAPRSGPCSTSSAQPCTADQHTNSAPGRRCAESTPAWTHSSSAEVSSTNGGGARSEERRVGKECRSRGARDKEIEKEKIKKDRAARVE